MQTDVLSAHITGDGSLVGYRTRVKGIAFLGDGTAGDIVLKDGGTSGTTKITIPVPANSNNVVYILLPGEGILFTTSVYADVPGSSSVTIFYG